MKKRLLAYILASSMLFAGCAAIPAKTSKTSAEDTSVTENSNPSSPVLKEYMSNPAVLETPVQQYGESKAFIQIEDDFMIRMLYPEGDLDIFDKTIEDWVNETVLLCQQEVYQNSNISAELTTNYNSYIVEDNWISVKITGLFDSPDIENPIDIIKTFNTNIKSGIALPLDSILLDGGHDALEKLVTEKIGTSLNYTDESLFNLWLLKPEGLEITLKRGEHISEADETVTLLFTYDELKHILSLTENEYILNAAENDNIISEQSLPSFIVDTDKPMIALTFDDGPNANTERLLDIFNKYGGKATFFVIGNTLDGRTETLKRIAGEGHEIASHSWDHRQLTNLTGQDIVDQIMATRAKIFDITGIDTHLLRPPYGSVNDELIQVCKDLDVIIVKWSVDPHDWKYKDTAAIYDTIMANVKDGDIILCHDIHGTTVDAMEIIIPTLINQGFQLVTVSDLLSTSSTEITPGGVYIRK